MKRKNGCDGVWDSRRETLHYLLDTNHLGHCLHHTSFLRDRLRAAIRSGRRIGTCAPVLCETEVLIQGSRDPAQRRRFFEQTLRSVCIWPLEPEVATLYGEFYHELQKRGRSLSQVDMMLAAMARPRRCILLTTDGNVSAFPDLTCENWLASS